MRSSSACWRASCAASSSGVRIFFFFLLTVVSLDVPEDSVELHAAVGKGAHHRDHLAAIDALLLSTPPGCLSQTCAARCPPRPNVCSWSRRGEHRPYGGVDVEPLLDGPVFAPLDKRDEYGGLQTE